MGTPGRCCEVPPGSKGPAFNCTGFNHMSQVVSALQELHNDGKLQLGDSVVGAVIEGVQRDESMHGRNNTWHRVYRLGGVI